VKIDGTFIDMLDIREPDGIVITGYVLGAVTSEAFLFIPEAMPAVGSGRNGVFVDSLPLLVFDRRGTFTGELGPSFRIELFSDGRRTIRRPLGFISSIAVGGRTVYVTTSARAEVERWDVNGRHFESLSWDQQAYRVTDQIKRTYVNSITTSINSRTQRRAARAWLQSVSWPDSIPSVGRIIAESTGQHLLVERPNPDLEAPHIEWLLLDTDGTPTMKLIMQRKFTPHILLPEAVIGVWVDSLGVEHLHRYSRSPSPF
jgi:hypothetical protein